MVQLEEEGYGRDFDLTKQGIVMVWRDQTWYARSVYKTSLLDQKKSSLSTVTSKPNGIW